MSFRHRGCIPRVSGTDWKKMKQPMQPPTYTHPPLRQKLIQLQQMNVQTKITQRKSNQLSEKIMAWLDAMTPEQRVRRFTTFEVECLAGLKGKNGLNVAHHHIGLALRNCGFRPKRDWTVAGRNKRYWIWSEK